ncbi:hypothetical protein [Oceanicoccus sagamiensis]|uniref:Uncharacterized protein n=1 Tax=Oceanicoccus sagamiensis TaxID=716816 RepID=A0A1X9NA33_9GAMM|nr:hypothetical protein [Oceanicoccus sagamiensis]ARN73302.1 hypothetical protein BST96_03780 [Oceanicoccus sagamiensis]
MKLLEKIYRAGGSVYINNGEIVIISPNKEKVSGKPLKKIWLRLAREIAEVTDIPCYRMTDYSTKQHPNRELGTVNLRFDEIGNGETVYRSYNCDIRYKKTGKIRPNKQFTAKSHSKFRKLCSLLDIPEPRSPSESWKLTRKLKWKLVTGEIYEHIPGIFRFEDNEILPLRIDEAQLRMLIMEENRVGSAMFTSKSRGETLGEKTKANTQIMQRREKSNRTGYKPPTNNKPLNNNTQDNRDNIKEVTRIQGLSNNEWLLEYGRHE